MKRLIFVIAVETVAIGALLVVALDVRLHHRFEGLGGLNLKGYRGPVMPARRPDELRIAVVGGSFAFGWGVAAHETFSGYLGRLVTEQLRNRTSPPTRATDVNLAGQGIAAQDYVARMRHFSYLKPDVICLVLDLGPEGPPAAGMPERSGVYALTGYTPILPVILKEKGHVLQGDERGRLASRVGGFFLVAGEWSDAADNGLRSWATDPRATEEPYGDVLAEAVKVALETARSVVVVVPPQGPGADARRGTALGGPREFAARVADPRVRVVDLAALADLDPNTAWINDMNLGAGGNSLAAGVVAPTVLDLIPN